MVLPWRSSKGAKKRNQLTSGDISVVQTKIPSQLRSSRNERIQSPRVALTSRDAANICRRLENAAAREVNFKTAAAREVNVECFKIVSEIKSLISKGVETNKNRLIQNGVVSALASCFESFSAAAVEEHARLLEEILFVLTSLMPLNQSEGFTKMGSTASLNCLITFLNVTNAKTRQNAAFCIREVLALDKKYVFAFTEIEGGCEGLVNIIKDSVSTSSTKSSLMAIYKSISCDAKIVARFLKFNLVESITELIINNDEKSVCERSLIVLNVICDNEQGRENVLRNALTVPLLVKKILRVSDLATQCSISILWKLWKEDKDGLLIEALQVGAFEKLLVVLQIGCEENTKEKASELLRNLNRCRNEIEKTNCIDSSMNLKYVKKSF